MHESFFCLFLDFVPSLSLVWGAGLLISNTGAPYAHSFLPCIRAGASALGCWFPASRGFAAASKDALLTATGLGLSYNG